ncbi:hypothetical protein [Microcoleus sp. EPA2]|uniref:hypothetical protein n=1 Tax=Microcoleus sp. EPA2 TaxID=2841654 RepID=UPI00312B4358
MTAQVTRARCVAIQQIQHYRIKSLGDRLNITTLDTVPRLREYAEKNKTCVQGFPNALPCEGHWNSQGHEQVGQLIAEHLCDKFKAEP